MKTVPLPVGLPEPVVHYYRAIGGSRLPVVETAVISGQARLTINRLKFAGRFRFVHQAGRNYRHYIEAAVLGYPLLKVNEFYLDSRGRMELPFGVTDDEPKINQAANLGLWAESMWLPSIFITDTRVKWEPIDATHAILTVPFEEEEDHFTVTFDPETGLLCSFEALRYRDPDDQEKSLWTSQVQGWETFHGLQVPSPAAAIWQDQGQPWAIFTVEEIVYNVDVDDYIRIRGI